MKPFFAASKVQILALVFGIFLFDGAVAQESEKITPASATIAPAPMQPPFGHSAAYRWLQKQVPESRTLDDMEDLANWMSFTQGADAIVDARKTNRPAAVSNVAAISLSTDRIHNGASSLLLRTPTKLEGPAPANGRGWGRSGIRRAFNGEDWTHFNRISLWIYPDLPGFYTTALDFRIYNDGAKKLPGLFGQEGETSIVLRNHEWNHVLWEISNVSRDKVTGFEASYGLSGNAPGEADSIKFYFDRLDLERVEPDKIEGWDVWPDRIAYSQAGYQAGAAKSAIGNDLHDTTFRLIDQHSGQVIISKPIREVNSHLGSFQVMDFSEVRTAGEYVLEAGGATTQPFPIGPDIWEGSIRKALNFFYAERCGAAIPGVHGICHRDWSCVYNGKRIMINGGWHDAGDLSQSLGSTGEIVYGMFSLAERLKARNENPELQERVLEEARWGLDWILKTSFGDGYRDVGSINSRRTNDILGDFDDVTATASNNPQANFVASAAEAIAARVLKENDPRLAAQCLKMAEADWQFAVTALDSTLPDPLRQMPPNASNPMPPNAPKQMLPDTPTKMLPKQIWTGTFDSDNIDFEIASEGILASVDLWKVTGDPKYEEKAATMSRLILAAQQRKRTDWDIPMTGFFYADTARTRLLHFVHRGRQQAHILALTELCQAFPDHPDWMKWYSAVTLYSDYVKTVARYTEPYNVLPASIYNDSEYLKTPESRRESFRQQVLRGIPLGKGNYLRLFPVWMDYRGHFGTILPEAQALANAAYLRGDLAAAQLATHQLEWVIGRNPFAESTMYGEGYDFSPLYSPSSGDIVGALPVGIQTREDKDVPYWPIQSTWTYKEVWGHPTGRWIWLMRNLYGPSLVEGQAAAAVLFKERTTGQEILAEPDPATMRFRIMLPEGQYTIRPTDKAATQSTANATIQSKDEAPQNATLHRTFLPGATYYLDLRPGKTMDFDISSSVSKKGVLTIKATARGTGAHHFNIRVDNLVIAGLSAPAGAQALGSTKGLTLQPGRTGTVEWQATILSRDTPWVIVVIPDDDLSRRQELTGAAWEK
jgi:glycosyl hydrolase family 9/cellulase-like Ig domain-containing protein